MPLLLHDFLFDFPYYIGGAWISTQELRSSTPFRCFGKDLHHTNQFIRVITLKLALVAKPTKANGC